MRVKIETIDGDLVVRIPRELADDAGLRDGREVELTVEDARLGFRTTSECRYTLEELLSRVTDENRHDEVDWGPPVGNEVW